VKNLGAMTTFGDLKSILQYSNAVSDSILKYYFLFAGNLMESKAHLPLARGVPLQSSATGSSFPSTPSKPENASPRQRSPSYPSLSSSQSTPVPGGIFNATPAPPTYLDAPDMSAEVVSADSGVVPTAETFSEFRPSSMASSSKDDDISFKSF